MPMPFNSQVPHFLEKTKAYCAKVLPLVFDNSLSYYETLCKFMHKLNECIDAINAQNLNIIEFTHMVSLEIEKFETYLENRMTEFENQLKAEWQEFKSELEAEWKAEKEVNRIFRETMTTEFNNFKNLINTNFENLKNELITDLDTFKNNLEEQQDDFEQHILGLQTAFEAREQAARVAYQNNLNNLFDVWKNQTLTYLTNQIDDWEDDTKAELQAYFELYISQQITTETASLQTAINNLNTNLNNERTARQNADDALQEQINQLTPEAGIKADAPDIHGNSQLYKINQSTQERENIYPVVNTDAYEDDRIFFNQYIIANTDYFTPTASGKLFARFSNSFTIPQNSITYIPNCFKLRIDDMQNIDPNVTTPLNALSMLDISINICYLHEPNNTRIDWGISNSAVSGVGYVPRFETTGDHLYLVIPIVLISYNTIDTIADTVELICSFSQYIGGSVASQNPIVIDDDLSTTSTNPVQNRIITAALNDRPTLNTVNNLLSTKANQSDLTALTNTVDTKANQADINRLDFDLETLEARVIASEIKEEYNTTLNQYQLYKGSSSDPADRTNIDPVCSFANKSELSKSIETSTVAVIPATTTQEGWYQLAEWNISHIPEGGYFGYNILFLINGSKSYNMYGNAKIKIICSGKKSNVGDASQINNYIELMESSSVPSISTPFTEDMFKLTFKMDAATKNIVYKLWWHKDAGLLTHSERFSFSLLAANDSQNSSTKNISKYITLLSFPTVNYQIGATGYLENDPDVIAVDCMAAEFYNPATKLSGDQTVLYYSTTATTSFTLTGLFTDWSAVMVYITGEWVTGTSGTHGFFVPLKRLKSQGTTDSIEDFCGNKRINFLYVDDNTIRWFEYQGQGAMTYDMVEIIGLY